jgi:hypothetical protein
MPDSFLANFGEHAVIFLSGMTALGIVAHAVNTFPTPQNKYGQWFLGLIQFIVGQRIAAFNTMQGKDTKAFGVETAADKIASAEAAK